MLDINMEYRKGILFVRLRGDLTVDSSLILDDELKKLVDNHSVRFITFNLEELKKIDIIGINTILKYNNALSKINGKALICGIQNKYIQSQINNSQLLQYIFDTSDELGAINYLNIGGYL